MSEKEIDEILINESGIVLLKKRSEKSFLEVIFSGFILILRLLNIVKRKFDFLVLTESRVIQIIRNEVYYKHVVKGIKSVSYNGSTTILKVIDQNQEFSFPLDKLRVTYDESKLIKRRLASYENRISELKM